MSETKFTPGPWEYEPDGRFGLVGADTHDGNGWIICDLSVRTDLICNAAEDLSPTILAEAEANAHLIAAAPDLYDAAEQMIRVLHGQPMTVAQGAAYVKLSDAFARAQGEA